MSTILIVGESPHAGAAPDAVPFDDLNGSHLAALAGLRSRAVLLQCVSLALLFPEMQGDWEANAARGSAHAIARHGLMSPVVNHHDIYPLSIIAVGKRVAHAFDVPTPDAGSTTPVPMVLATWRHAAGPLITYIPNPGGRSTALVNPEPRQAIRLALMTELILGAPMLRPWHFNLADPAVLAALAIAISPTNPAVGAAAMLWAVAQHKAREARVATPLLAQVAAQGVGPAVMQAAKDERHTGILPPAWDAPLRTTLRTLLARDGARDLADWWRPDAVPAFHANAGNKWLLKQAEDYDHITEAAPLHAIRATMTRYAMEASL